MTEIAGWYHCHSEPVRRSSGNSAVGLASYITGQSLYDERIKDWRHRGHPGEVMGWGSTAPKGAAAWLTENEQLSVAWNAVERSETRINARPAIHTNFALSREFSKEDAEAVCAAIAQRVSDKYRVLTTWGIHKAPDHGDHRNLHGHIGWSLREIEGASFGAKVRAPVGRQQQRKDELEWLRKTVEEAINERLELIGSNERVTRLSYEKRGIAKEPQKHLGNKQNQAELKGFMTPTGNENRDIRQRNEAYEAEIISLQTERMRRLKLETAKMLSQHDHNIHREAAEFPPAAKKLVSDIEQGKEAYDEFMKRREAEAQAYADQEKKRQADQRGGDDGIANPHSYYATATTRFNINDIKTVTFVIDEEYRNFMRRQEERVKQEAEESDPTKKKTIELARRIEGADFLVVTSERMAVWSAYTTGKHSQPEGAIYKEIRELEYGDQPVPKTAAEEHMERANKWREFAEGWREERHELLQIVRENEMAGYGQKVKEAMAGNEQTADMTGAKTRMYYGKEVNEEQWEQIQESNRQGEESEAAIEASRGRATGNSR